MVVQAVGLLDYMRNGCWLEDHVMRFVGGFGFSKCVW